MLNHELASLHERPPALHLHEVRLLPHLPAYIVDVQRIRKGCCQHCRLQVVGRLHVEVGRGQGGEVVQHLQLEVEEPVEGLLRREQPHRAPRPGRHDPRQQRALHRLAELVVVAEPGAAAGLQQEAHVFGPDDVLADEEVAVLGGNRVLELLRRVLGTFSVEALVDEVDCVFSRCGGVCLGEVDTLAIARGTEGRPVLVAYRRVWGHDSPPCVPCQAHFRLVAVHESLAEELGATGQVWEASEQSASP